MSNLSRSFVIPADLHSDYFVCSGDKIIPFQSFIHCISWWETLCDITTGSTTEVCVQYIQTVDENCTPLAPPLSAGVYEVDKLTPYIVQGVLADCPPLTNWIPANIGLPLAGWYDAFDLATVSSVSGVVSQWDDKSGNDFHLTQSNINRRPLTNVDVINGKNAITFDGIDDVLLTTGHPLGTTYDDVFLYVVADIKTVERSVAWTLAWGGGVLAYSHMPWLNGNVFFDSGTNSGPNRLSWPSGFSANEKIMLGFYNSTTVSTQEIWSSGSLVASDTTGHTVPLAGQVLSLGASPNGGLADNIAYGEVILLDGVVTTDTRQRIEGYLAHKWFGVGIANALPIGHPYKDIPPQL